LSRGFLAAGAPQVVASLWDVDDASTAALMQAFFQRIATAARNGEPLRAALALRDAKRAVAARPGWEDPYYWAAFVAAGAAAVPASHHDTRR
jgi:CHAT domain-containing protein